MLLFQTSRIVRPFGLFQSIVRLSMVDFRCTKETQNIPCADRTANHFWHSISTALVGRCIRGCGLGLVFVLVFTFGLGAGELRSQDIDPAKADRMIRQSISFLYQKMDDDHWPEQGGVGRGTGNFAGGMTALCTLALLSAGESPDDPRIASALRYLETTPRDDHRTTYVVSLRVMVYALADPNLKRYGPVVQRDVRWLVQNQYQGKDMAQGGWSYEEGPSFGADPSNTQFAILALNEAVQLGVPVDREVWVMADKYWKSQQNPDGGFGYGGPSTGSMTCAGISSVTIIEDNLLDPANFLNNGQVDCCQTHQRSERIRFASTWLSKAFSASANPRSQNWKYYYLYGLERAGRLTGTRFFGDHDWYREGVAHLLVQQNAGSGSFSEDRSPFSAMRDTAFALLFSAKGLRPILFGKYQYTNQSDNWDLHPEGIHMLSRETEKAWNLPLNWQTVNGLKATVNDLRQSPVLFISGKDDFQLNDEQKNALRSYVENGGFIFAEACQGNGCGENVGFDRSFRALMKELFPDSTLEPLKAEHPIWTAQFAVKPDAEILGLQACCRTSVVYAPKNLSCFWQLDRPNFLEQLPRNVRTQIEWHRQFGINVAAYATGREVQNRLSVPKVDDRLVNVLENRVLLIPKLKHNGGFDEAPNAWKNAQREFASATGFDIKIDKKFVPLAFDDRSNEMANYPLIFMHGRTAVSFDDKEREALKTYLELGNTLFVDSICASDDFTQSFKKEIEKIFPGELKPLNGDHRLLTGAFTGQGRRQGHDLTKLSLRKPDLAVERGFRSETMPAQLWGVERDGRLVVILSPYDLSCALENASANQCSGYSKSDAAKICTNVILYVLFSD